MDGEIGAMHFWLYILAVNALTFMLYWFDKHAARHGNSRVPEFVLLLFGFIGGSVGGLAAQRIIRHKTKKRSFQFKFWALVLVQIWLICLPPPVFKTLLVRFFA